MSHKISITVLVLLSCSLAFARPQIAADWESWYGTGGSSGIDSDTMAIMEAATGKRCQVCHRGANGGDPWNAYGWAIRSNLEGNTNEQAFALVESLDSDGNGDTNLEEIVADAQPGWTITGNLAFPASGPAQPIPDDEIPPASPLDPAAASTFACCFDSGACSVLTTGDCSVAGGIPDTSNSTCFPNMCPQPTGACCNLDETCSNNIAADVCIASGGTPQGPGSQCSDVAVDCGLQPFVDALPIPGVLEPIGTLPDGTPQYEMSIQPALQQLHSELPATQLWTYNGLYPGQTIEARVNEPIEVTYINNLPSGEHLLEVDECSHGPDYYSNSRRVVTHLHGGHVPARFDGQPEYHLMPGDMDVYQYPNSQLPATMWYHDHALGITRLNVYSGLAGYYLLRDDFEDALGLPSGEFEIPTVIQDRQFNADGSLSYPNGLPTSFFGDKVLVNGKVWPSLQVHQGKYRLRMVNGSQARSYSLRLENLDDPAQVIPFTLIGTDLGLISAPISLPGFDMVPAERFDVVIDFASFAAGTQIILRNDDTTSPLVPNVMRFVVTDQPGHTDPVPATLRPITPLVEADAEMTRWFRLQRIPESCAGNEWVIQTLDGPGGAPTGAYRWDDLSEFVQLGATEIWAFENPAGSVAMMHPMHIHLVSFQVLDRTLLSDGTTLPLAPHESNTWKDTVAVQPGTRVRVIAQYNDHLGRFAYHCHLLDHEDHEMMRQFVVVNDPANCDLDGVCEAGEDGFGCADCGQVSGALCGNGLCETGDGEDCLSCAADCNGVQSGNEQFCCGNGGTNPIGCGDSPGDSRCIDTSADRFCRIHPRVEATCGDLLCEGQETAGGCPQDCSQPFCEPSESGDEISCDDGQDNDCDGFVDLSDSDCPLPDIDSDGITDADDNCPLVANGSLIPDAGGNSQRDSDADNIGNICDPDIAIPNDCVVNFADLDVMKTAFFSNSAAANWNPDADLDGDGGVNFADLDIIKSFFFGAPGPGGPASNCAGQ